MPQLMPLYWKISVLMSFLLVLGAVVVFGVMDYKMGEEEKGFEGIKIAWKW